MIPELTVPTDDNGGLNDAVFEEKDAKFLVSNLGPIMAAGDIVGSWAIPDLDESMPLGPTIPFAEPPARYIVPGNSLFKGDVSGAVETGQEWGPLAEQGKRDLNQQVRFMLNETTRKVADGMRPNISADTLPANATQQIPYHFQLETPNYFKNPLSNIGSPVIPLKLDKWSGPQFQHIALDLSAPSEVVSMPPLRLGGMTSKSLGNIPQTSTMLPLLSETPNVQNYGVQLSLNTPSMPPEIFGIYNTQPLPSYAPPEGLKEARIVEFPHNYALVAGSPMDGSGPAPGHEDSRPLLV